MIGRNEITVMCALVLFPYNFIVGRRLKLGDFYYLMKTILPLKKYVSHKLIEYTDKLLFCFFLLICVRNGKFVTFVFESVQLKLQYFECFESGFSENSHALPGNIG